MGNLITTYSSVSYFVNSTSRTYLLIVNKAIDIRERVKKLSYQVHNDLEAITRQIFRGQRLLEDIQLKENKYRALADAASAEVRQYEEEINYILNNPITRTYTDDDGNTTTVEEIDEHALAVAQRAKANAIVEYEKYNAKYEEARAIKCEVSATISRFQTIKTAIQKVSDLIQSDLYEINKYVSAIQNEKEYNIQILYSVLNKMSEYLECKQFCRIV